MSGMLVWSTRWEQLNNWAPPQILMLECANHNKLATLHLEFVNNSLFLTTYMQRIYLKIENVQMIDWMVHMSTKAILHEHHKHISLITTRNIINVHANFILECQPLIGVNTLTWAPNTTKTKPLPTMSLFLFKMFSYHILITSKLHVLCVYE